MLSMIIIIILPLNFTRALKINLFGICIYLLVPFPCICQYLPLVKRNDFLFSETNLTNVCVCVCVTHCGTTISTRMRCLFIVICANIGYLYWPYTLHKLNQNNQVFLWSTSIDNLINDWLNFIHWSATHRNLASEYMSLVNVYLIMGQKSWVIRQSFIISFFYQIADSKSFCSIFT